MLYDYKSDELIQDVVVECLCPVVADIIDEYSTLRRDEYILMYVPAYLAVEIMNRFLEDVEESYIDSDADIGLLTDDDNEVILTFSADGTVYVEEARGCHHIKDAEGSALAYVYDDFLMDDVKIICNDENSVLVFGFEDDDCEGCKSEDTELTSTASYTVNGKSVTKAEFDKKYEEFENKYMDNIRDMLLNYCDLMDSFNDWQKRFW